MNDDGISSNGDIRPEPPFIDPVTGEPVPAGTAEDEPAGWLPPSVPPGGQAQYGGWLPPAAGPHIPIAPSVWVTPVRREYATWWSRVGANLVDSFIIMAPIAILAFVVYWLVDGGSITLNEDLELVEGSFDGGQIAILIVALIAAGIYGLGYAPFWMARTNGQTIGKQVAKIRVIRVDGQPIGFWFAAAREIGLKGFAVGIAGQLTVGIATFVNYLWPLWDDENRAVHDIVIKTRVVRVIEQPAREAETDS